MTQSLSALTLLVRDYDEAIAFFVGTLSGTKTPLLNGRPLGEEPVLLADADVLDLDGTQMRFQLKE